MTPRSSAPPAAEWPDREARAPSAAGLGRALAVGVVLLELLWIAYVFVHLLPTPAFGLDYQWHVDATRRLITVGTPYWPWQTAGPYTIGNGAILYPPTAFLLFLPFLWLPAPLWWIIPIAITVAAMTRHRPPIWIWPLTVGLFCLEGR